MWSWLRIFVACYCRCATTGHHHKTRFFGITSFYWATWQQWAIGFHMAQPQTSSALIKLNEVKHLISRTEQLTVPGWFAYTYVISFILIYHNLFLLYYWVYWVWYGKQPPLKITSTRSLTLPTAFITTLIIVHIFIPSVLPLLSLPLLSPPLFQFPPFPPLMSCCCVCGVGVWCLV